MTKPRATPKKPTPAQVLALLQYLREQPANAAAVLRSNIQGRIPNFRSIIRRIQRGRTLTPTQFYSLT